MMPKGVEHWADEYTVIQYKGERISDAERR